MSNVRPGEAYGLAIGRGSAPVSNQTLPVPVAHFDAHPGSIDNPYFPRSLDEAAGLPSGAHFYDPAGVLRSRY
jgi:hypothetical protein